MYQGIYWVLDLIFNKPKRLTAILLLLGCFFSIETFAKIKVLVIDTGIEVRPEIIKYLSVEHKTDSKNYVDTNGHGTHITGIILYGDMEKNGLNKPVCDDVEIYSCKYFFQGSDTVQESNSCLKRAVREKFDLINYSGGGFQKSLTEKALIKKIAKMGTKIITSAGNYNLDIRETPYYPASYRFELNIKELIVVGSVDRNNKKHQSSSYGDEVEYELGVNMLSFWGKNGLMRMTGTSQATAFYTYKQLFKLCEKNK